jgi:DNA polymerase III delta prime subunit
MSTATPDDVRGVIATDLTDSEIQAYLDDAEYDADNAITDYDTALTSTDRTQLEKYYAALLIRQLRDKAIQSTSRETASVSYEGSAPSISALQHKVDERDPSGTLAYNVDSSRYVNSGP